jgi:hypothetical protein
MEFIDYGSLTDILEQYPRGLEMSEAEIAYICLHVCVKERTEKEKERI